MGLRLRVRELLNESEQPRPSQRLLPVRPVAAAGGVTSSAATSPSAAGHKRRRSAGTGEHCRHEGGGRLGAEGERTARRRPGTGPARALAVVTGEKEELGAGRVAVRAVGWANPVCVRGRAAGG
jgi:hypothetical protein